MRVDNPSVIVPFVPRSQVAPAAAPESPQAPAPVPQASLPAPPPLADHSRLSAAPRLAVARAAGLAQATLDGNIWTVKVKSDPLLRSVILAGTAKFDALWTRDGSYAMLGALATGRHRAVKDTLTVLLDNQFPDGLTPRRVGSDSTIVNTAFQALGINRGRATQFNTVDRVGIFGELCPDSNLWTPIVMADYLARTGDQAFAAGYFGKLEKGMAWIRTQLEDGLLTHKRFSDWKDVVDRGRITMYNNALFFGALRSMGDLAERLGDPAKAAGYRAEAAALATKLREKMWNADGGFFRDSELIPHFAPDGNLWAVALGLTTPEETASIFAKCEQLLTQHPLLPAAEKRYPRNMIHPTMFLNGMHPYHDLFYWPHLTSLYAIAAARAGDQPRAEAALARVAEVVNRDREFYEIYEGTPPKVVKRPLYTAERGFSESAGTFLRARAEVYGERAAESQGVAS